MAVEKTDQLTLDAPRKAIACAGPRCRALPRPVAPNPLSDRGGWLSARIGVRGHLPSLIHKPMKILLKILGGLAVLVLLLVLVAFVLPRQYRVERSLVINARPEAVLAQVADLRAWKNWGAWQERDPQMKLSYSDQPVGVGSWSAWESNKEGNGKMTIIALTATKVTYHLEFPDAGMQSTGWIELLPRDGGSQTVWVDTGDLGLNPVNRWFGLFLDKLIGPDFERGLANLKKRVEK